MISIYDDVSYVESMNNIMMNEKEEVNIQIPIRDIENKDSIKQLSTHDDDDFEYIINKTCQKNMFEKLLKETLEELNKTNPALEPFKYHRLCLYSNRYDRFIKKINNLIMNYELKQLKKIKTQHPYSHWYWNWKTMTFNIIKHVHDYYNTEKYYEKHYNEFNKNINDKKKD